VSRSLTKEIPLTSGLRTAKVETDELYKDCMQCANVHFIFLSLLYV